MKRITVMYVWNDLGIGGAALSLLDTLKIIKNNIECIVVIRQKCSMIDYLNQLKIRSYIVPFSCDYGKKDENTNERANQSFLNDYEMAIQLANIIKKENVNLVHINSSISNVGAIAALMAGIPYIWHIRELIYDHFECSYYDDRLKNELFANANGLISISDCVKQKVLDRYNVESIRLYNGLDIEKYRNRIENNTYNSRFLLAGVISEGKGQWDAVRAVELLVSKGYSDIELFIVGDGDEILKWSIEKYVERRNLKKNIHLISFKQDLKKYRNLVSYSITSSKMEALGRTTIEAMLAGNIVIGANTGGTKEIVGDNQERGYLYQQGDYYDLACVMQKVLEETNDKKNRIRKIAQEYAVSNFDAINYCNKLCKIYIDIVEKSVLKNESIYVSRLAEKYEVLSQRIRKADWMIENNNDIQMQKVQLAYFWTLKWLEVKQKGLSLIKYLQDNNISTVAIYGMAQLGCKLYDEFEKTDIIVKYVIDRKQSEVSRIIDMISPQMEFPKVDAIIVTVISQEEEIVQWLNKKCCYKIWGLSHILTELLDDKCEE